MREVGVHLLANGMSLYYGEQYGVNTSGIGVKCGSIHDPAGKSGMAHFLEHMITIKSRRYTDPKKIDLLFHKYMGGPDDDINIRTDRYSTFYGHNDLLRRKHMEEIFDVLASFVHPRTMVMDEECLVLEAPRVHNEYCLRGVDIMEEFLDDAMHRAIYEKNPARNRVDCEIEDIKTMTTEKAREFLRLHYVPKNMFVIILGPSKERAIEIAERYFGDWTDESEPPELDYDHSEDSPVLPEIRSFEFVRPGIHQHHFAAGFKTETYMTADAEAIDVLARILELRLRWRFAENKHFDGGAYRVPVLTERSFVHGVIYARFATVGGEFAARGENIIVEELNKLKIEKVSSEEFSSVTNSVLYKHLNAFSNMPGALSEMIIDAAANGDGDLKGLNSFRRRLGGLTREKVLEAANKYFADSYARVLITPA